MVGRASNRLRCFLSAAAATICASTFVVHAQDLPKEIYAPPTGRAPAVVVVSGGNGIAGYRDFSAKLAATGYYVVLIDGNDVLIRPSDVRGLDGAANLLKVIREAKAADKAISGKVALVGFSLGGGGVLLHGAPLGEHVAAVVAYYPAITYMGPDMRPLASRMQAPVLVLAGGKDRYKGCCVVESMRALADAPKTVPFELVVYPDAHHAFNLPFPQVYREEDANDAWRRTTDFLRLHLPPGGG